MTLAAKKKMLHNYIETADPKKITSIFNLVEDDIETIPENVLQEIYNTRENYKNGKEKFYTEKEFWAIMKKNKNV